MKYLSLILAFMFVVVAANAAGSDDFNPLETANANFDCMVIAPLSWNQPADVTLEEVIAGQTRDIADVNVNFILTGQEGYDVVINTYGPTQNSGATTGTVQLIGSWSHTSGDQAQLDPTAGTKTVTYTVDKIESTDPNDHGTYTFTINVDAQYVGI